MLYVPGTWRGIVFSREQSVILFSGMSPIQVLSMLYSADDNGVRTKTCGGLDLHPASPVDLPIVSVAEPGG